MDDSVDTRGGTPGASGEPPDRDDPTQGVLPLDLHPDEPVPFRLTPKARRLVAPHTIPTLEVVGDDDAGPVPEDLDDPHDPRSARARALRRGGMSVADIAHRLDVDELAVRSWTGDLGTGRRRHRLRAVAPTRRPSPPTTDDVEDRLARRHATFTRVREQAAAEGPARLADPAFLRGLALTVAAAELDEHAILVTVRDRDVATVVSRWLVEHAGADPREMRVVLRLGSAVGADLAVHRWAEALGLALDRISRTVWRSAPSEDALEAMLRLADVTVAARVAGWRDVLLAGDGPRHLPQVGG